MKKSALTLCLLAAPLIASDQIPTSLTILQKENLVGRPYFSLADALSDVPSLNVERVGAQGTRAIVKMRGVPGEENVMILMDGENLSHSFDGKVDVSQIPINIVERIEISRGGGPVSLGSDGAAGTINIITIRPHKKGLSSRIGTGVGRDGVKHSHGQFTGRSNLGDLTYLGSVEEAKGFLSNEDSAAQNHFMNLSRSFRGHGYWGIEYFYQESDVGLGQGTAIPFSEWNGLLEQQSENAFRSKKEEHQHAKIFLVSPKIYDGTIQFTVAHRTREFDTYSIRGENSIRDQENRTLDSQLKWRRKTLEVGLRRSHYRRNIFPFSEEKTYENAIYAYQKISWRNWSFVPGVHLKNHSEANSASDLRLSTLFAATPELSFSSTLQTAHRFPNFEELFYSTQAIANPNLKPEKSNSFDLGIAWSPSSFFESSLTGFRTNISNAIEADSENRLNNSGKNKSTGLETSVRITIGKHSILLQGTRLKSSNNDQSSALTPEKIGSLQLQHRLPRSLTLSNTIRYQGTQWENTGKQGLKIPSYYIWNLRLGCKVHLADLYFEAHNITRRRFADTVDYFTPSTGPIRSRLAPQAERTFWAGVSIPFEN